MNPTPTPKDLAARLRMAAAMLDAQGKHAVRLAPELAARGYPSSTLGDGGARGTTPGSSVERAALNADPTRRFVAVDVRLYAQFRTLWMLCNALESTVAAIVVHASDEDPLPAGSGACQCCDRMCRPDAKPGDRLRAGYCPACYEAWRRLGQPDRVAFELDRRRHLAPKAS
jgi:hypothetical protein